MKTNLLAPRGYLILIILFFLHSAFSQSVNYSAPLDISTNDISWVSSFDVSAQTTFPLDVAFSADGNTMYIVQTAVIRQYSLNSPFSLSSGGVYTGLTSLSSQETSPRGVAFSNDGTKMFIVGTEDQEVNQYNLTHPFDITSGVTVDGSPFSVAAQDDFPESITFSNDGKKFFIVGNSDMIHQYSLTTAFDINGGVIYDGNPLDISDEDLVPMDIVFDPSGTKMLMVGTISDEIHQYTLSSPFDITSGVTLSESPFDIVSIENEVRGIELNPSVNKIFLLGSGSNAVNELSIGTNNLFIETLSNDGSVNGEMIVSIKEDQFTNPGSTLSGISIDNLPTGLSPDLSIHSSGTFGTLTLIGNAANNDNSNDVSNLTFTFSNSAFVNSSANSVNNAKNANSGFGIDFDPQPSFKSTMPGAFTEGTTGIIYDVDALDGLGGLADENVTYTISGGADQAFFTIDNATGNISVINPLDYNIPADQDGNNVFVIEVSADNSAHIVTEQIELSLVDVIERIDYSIPVDITNNKAKYDDVSFSLITETSTPLGLHFNNDGTKMFVLGSDFTEEYVYQYSLNTPFDISDGVSYDNVSFFVGNEEINPFGLTFNPSGTKMFIIGNSKKVNQYTLTTPFDLSSGVSYDGSPLNLSADVSYATDLAFNNSGTKLYVSDLNNDAILQYSLVSSFDVREKITYEGRLSVGSQDGKPNDFTFDATGTKLLMLGEDGTDVNQYSLTTPFDITTGVSFDGSPFNIGSEESSPEAIFLSKTGTKMFITGRDNDRVSQYTLGSDAAFSESGANDGSVIGEIFITLTGDTFTGAGTHLSTVTIPNLPSGLTANLLVDASASFGTLTLGDNASAHTNIEDVSSLQFTFDNTSFQNSTAANVIDAELAFSGLGIDFDPLPAFLTSNIGFFSEPAMGPIFDVDASIGIDGEVDENVIYSLNGGNDDSFFSIDSNTGIVNGVQVLDFENPEDGDSDNIYEITINASNGSESVNQSVSLTLLDVDESIRYTKQIDLSGDGVVFSGKTFDLTAEGTDPKGIKFNQDGSKCFIISNDRKIFQYSLASPFDLGNTITYNGFMQVTFEEFRPTDLEFSADGTKVFIIGTSGDDINQYTLTTPFDVTSGTSFDGVVFSVASQEGNPEGMAFNSSGTRLFMVGNNNRTVYQYNLSKPFDLGLGASYSGQSFNLNNEGIIPKDITFDPSGTNMFIVGSLNDAIYQYSLSTPYDLSSTISYDGTALSIVNEEIVPEGIAFDNIGSKMFLVGSDQDKIQEYTLGTTFAFVETSANNGSLDGEIIVSLTGDLFTSAGINTTDLDINNIPTGITASFTVSDDRTYAVINLEGNASSSQNADDVTDIQISFADAAFSKSQASHITQAIAANTGLGIDFNDNNAPVFVNATTTISIPENTIGVVLDVNANNGENGANDFGLTYTLLSSNDFDLFHIEETTGEISFIDPADFENPEDGNIDNEYILEVEANDGIFTSSQQFSISVENINENPLLTDQSIEIVENTPNGTSLATLTGTDEDENSTLTYSISEGNTNNTFQLNATSGELTVAENSTLDFEVNPVFSLTVEVSDGELTDQATVTVNLTDVQEAPLIVDQSFEIEENRANTTLVGTISATDADQDELTFSITNGNTNDTFELNPTSGELTVAENSALDFEVNPVFSLTVEVSDGELTDQATITVNLTDVQEAPVILDQSFEIEENTANTTLVGTISATDADNDALSFSILSGNTNDTFELNPTSGELTVAENSALDFEVNPVFNLTVEVSDGELTDQATITVNLTDVQEAPIIVDQSFEIEENTANTTLVGTISATDTDQDELTFSIIDGNTNDAFDLNPTSGELTVAENSTLDFEVNPIFSLTVEVSDGELTGQATITVNLTDVQEAPVIVDQSFEIEENTANTTLVGTISATDAENDALSFSILSGNTNNAFELNPTSGELTVAENSTLDFEVNPIFSLTVEVSDGELAGQATITVNLTDVQEAPVIVDQSFEIEENTANTTLVGTISATDAENDALSFSILSGNTNDAFELNPTSGELTVAENSTLDFEVNPVFSLTVEVSDGELTGQATITVNLTDVQEAPVIVDQSFEIEENTANTTLVGTISATDADQDELTFSITNGNTNDTFELNPTSGELTVAENSTLDFEVNPVFSLTVEVSDGELTGQATITVNLTDVQEAPVIVDQSFEIEENRANTTLVGTISATDADQDELTFSITNGNTNDAFELNSTSGELTVAENSALDFEVNPVFNLTVEVSDGELTGQATITVNLTDVQEAPVIVDQSFEIEENTANTTVVGTISATDADNDDLSFSILSGNTNDAFELNPTSGELIVLTTSALDFETTPTFSLIVEVSDENGGNASATITVNLNDVDESSNTAPTITNQTFSLDENTPNNTTVGSIVASDPDNDDLSFSILSGNTNDAFELNPTSGELTVLTTSALDFETTPTFSLIVEVSDENGGNASATITVNLNDVDESSNTAPTIANQAFSLDENTPNNTAVGSIVASDPDNDDLSFSILSGNTNDAFELNPTSGELTVLTTSALDFETTPTFSLIVEVSDGNGGNASATITVNLNDVDESANTAPTIANQTFSLDENTPNNTAVGSIVASDPDNDDLSFSILSGNTNDAFELNANSGELTVLTTSALDFETTPTFSLIVEVSDGNGGNASATITVNLNDVDESANTAPTIANQTFSLDENTPNNTAVGSIVASDPDNDDLSFSILSGNTNDAFELNANSGELTVLTTSALDFETTPTFSLIVEVSDGNGGNASATITVNLNDVDESANTAPTIANQTFSLDENTPNNTAVGSIGASDPDNDDLSFSILSGNTNDAFELNPTSGELTVLTTSALDFETTPTFSLIVEVSDGNGGNASATITVNLNDVDESANTAPTIANQTFSLDENTPNNTAVGSIVASDPDNDDLSFSILSGNTNDAFELNPTSGELTVLTTSALDFETTPTFSLIVEVSDGNGGNASATITVNLNDVDESANTAPTIANQTFSLDENTPNNTAVGSIGASDPDNDDLSFSILSGNTNDAFELNPTSGELTVLTTSALDFETTPTFSLIVEVSDGNGGNASATITVNLNDVDESANTAPTIANQTFSLDENTPNNTAVGSIVASDPDNDDLSFSILSGNTNDAFELNPNSGELTVLTTSALDFETNPTFSLIVEVSDGNGGNASATITVNLNDVDESSNTAPTIANQTFSLDENTPNNTAVGSIVASDPDNDDLSFSILSGNANDAFELNANSGELTVLTTSALDFETTPTFSLIVEVSDGNGGNVSATITVNLNDVDEGVELSNVNILEDFRAFPNPASDWLFLQTETSALHNATINLHDLAGKQINIEIKVIDENNVQMNLSDVSSGIYTLIINGAKFNLIKKIVRQ